MTDMEWLRELVKQGPASVALFDLCHNPREVLALADTVLALVEVAQEAGCEWAVPCDDPFWDKHVEEKPERCGRCLALDKAAAPREGTDA